MQKLLANASLKLDPEMKAQLENKHEGPVGGGQPRLLSAVNTVFLSNKNTEKLGSPVNFSFSHLVSPWVGRGICPTVHPIGSVMVAPPQSPFPHLRPFCCFLHVPQGLCPYCALCLGQLSLT